MMNNGELSIIVKQMINSARSHNKENSITYDLVIKGLKFICENQNISQLELTKGLINLGCVFTLNDIQKQYNKELYIFDEIKKANIYAGATIIINARDSIEGFSYIKEKFLSVDDEESIYHFIRVLTNDNNYTKEYIDSLNNEKRLIKKNY